MQVKKKKNQRQFDNIVTVTTSQAELPVDWHEYVKRHVCIIQLSLKEYSYYILNHNLSSFKTKNKQVCQMSNYKLVMFNMKFKTCMLMCLC